MVVVGTGHTASLIVGVAASSAASGEIPVAGTAGPVAGAMSMAAGAYVSVSSRSDTEQADPEEGRAPCPCVQIFRARLSERPNARRRTFLASEARLKSRS